MTAPDPAAIWAALDAAEQTAKAATRGPWSLGRMWRETVVTRMPFCRIEAVTEANARHIAAWDPAAVLRHIAAARQILDSAVETLESGCGAYPFNERCIHCRRATATLTALAAAWQPAQQETP